MPRLHKSDRRTSAEARNDVQMSRRVPQRMNASPISGAESLGVAGRFRDLGYTVMATAREDNERWMAWVPIRWGC